MKFCCSVFFFIFTCVFADGFLMFESLLLFISIFPFEFHFLSFDFKLFELSMKGFSIHVRVLVFSKKNVAITLLFRVG